MNRILISVFDTEEAAYEGVRALKDLHRDGDITLYASEVIVRDAHGQVMVRQAAARGPIGTLVGVVSGGLVGLLSGTTGAAVGAYVGGTGGVLYDLFTAGFGMEVVDDVADTLTPGTAAVVADIDESWVTPVETRLGALGAKNFRRLRREVLHEQSMREAEATKVELEHLRAELREATAETRDHVQAAIDARQRKLEVLTARLDTAIDDQRAEVEARLATLRAQWEKARGERKDRIDARITWVKSGHEARQAKLKGARVNRAGWSSR